jgi:hypothetical protein
MTKLIKGAVYTPTAAGMPPVAVILGTDGEVLVARVVPSVSAGNELLRQITEQFAAAVKAGEFKE